MREGEPTYREIERELNRGSGPMWKSCKTYPEPDNDPLWMALALKILKASYSCEDAAKKALDHRKAAWKKHWQGKNQ